MVIGIVHITVRLQFRAQSTSCNSATLYDTWSRARIRNGETGKKVKRSEKEAYAGRVGTKRQRSERVCLLPFDHLATGLSSPFPFTLYSIVQNTRVNIDIDIDHSYSRIPRSDSTGDIETNLVHRNARSGIKRNIWTARLPEIRVSSLYASLGRSYRGHSCHHTLQSGRRARHTCIRTDRGKGSHWALKGAKADLCIL